MIKPTNSDVKPIEDLDVNQLEKWLRSGLKSEIFSEDRKNIQSFEPLHDFIGKDTDLTEDLVSIYDALKPSAQENFKEALVNLLIHLSQKDENVKLLEEILFLSGSIRAHGIIPILPGKLGNGFFGSMAEERRQQYFITAIETIASFAEPKAKSSYDCLVSLINSRYFFSEYADTAFIALCEIYPELFLEHFNLIKKHINKLLNINTITQSQLQDIAWQLVAVVPTNIIAKEISCFFTNCAISDRWLFYALLDGDDPPLDCIIQDDFFAIRRKGKKEQSWLTLEIDYQAKHSYWYFDALKKISKFPKLDLEGKDKSFIDFITGLRIDENLSVLMTTDPDF